LQAYSLQLRNIEGGARTLMEANKGLRRLIREKEGVIEAQADYHVHRQRGERVEEMQAVIDSLENELKEVKRQLSVEVSENKVKEQYIRSLEE
jgi:hypothetical protein